MTRNQVTQSFFAPKEPLSSDLSSWERQLAQERASAIANRGLPGVLAPRPVPPLIGPMPGNFQLESALSQDPPTPRPKAPDKPVKPKPDLNDTDKPPKDPEPGDYSDEGAALSAEIFGQLAARRRAADEELQFAMEREATQTKRLQLAANTAREQTVREFRNLTEDMMRVLAGRGTARAPMVAGRGARRIQVQKDQRFGQISQTLADEISALQEMVQMAERERNRVVATISQEEALLRTAPNLLLPAAAAFIGSR